ncbi:MAG TPA: hypothetical protein H9875_00545 [Candidatus Levilactobacillus faecigallinarum]|uniref:Uncharacterized protein n=1 Tax=Candidatus Levilactobacillus faecigallinarum TaxID=2838638 RepID=A0A9D1QS90_9LACO|nr:hypothetical protein [Candidatus Levilactobacillus faecigallinarum]
MKKLKAVLGGIWESTTLATGLELVAAFLVEGWLRRGSKQRKNRQR